MRRFRVDLSPAARDENFGLRFRGFFSAPEAGVYRFFLTSDDGSRLLVDSDELIDNDGIHGSRERTGYVALAAGLHPIELVFFQGRAAAFAGGRWSGHGETRAG